MVSNVCTIHPHSDLFMENADDFDDDSRKK